MILTQSHRVTQSLAKMKTKTIKTPLMTTERDALSYRPVTIVPESKLSHMASVHYGFVTKLSHHGGKTPRFALKNHFEIGVALSCFYCFSSDDVFSCKATSDEVRACAGACSQAPSHDVSTKARSAKTSQRGF